MRRQNIFIMLENEENLALVTWNGELESTLTRNDQNFRENADIVQYHMVQMMKNREPRQGRWIWKIRDNWQTIEGWELKEGPEDVYELHYL